ncbi:MAG: sugar phosphate isomerase/epimerase [Gemmatimonadetes bacterium]|nr:sugar phosphate isomerase/epimerase [Gemmatimonadota bacterium]
MESGNTTAGLTRRGFLSGAATAAAGTYAFGPGLVSEASAMQQAGRPNSTINGVRLGINAPYSFKGQFTSAEETLRVMVQLGLSWVELRGPTIEGYAGMPTAAALPANGPAGSPAAAARQAVIRDNAERLKRWRLSQSMDKYKELRRMYEQAGVTIQLVKFPDLTANLSDDEAAYIFEVAKAMGAEAITTEPPVSHTKRLGQLASKHRVMIGYHGHAAVNEVEAFARPGSWEQAFFYSPFNGANPDIGHWIAGNNESPASFIREYAHRITNLHIKDRKKNQGANTEWGQGDTPIADILRLMRDQKYTFQATIEMEHPLPAGSDVLTELARVIDFARRALNS